MQQGISPDTVMSGEWQEADATRGPLFSNHQVLRRKKKATRAADLATLLKVSERTIYRDISDMIARDVPIEGEAGVGYILRPGFDLPPLMFNENEIEALLLGTRIVQSWADRSDARDYYN